MTPNTSSTCAECMTIVVVPAAVASSAAINFVDIPPVPSDVPRVDVETRCQHLVDLIEHNLRTLLPDFLNVAHNSHRLGIGIIAWIVGVSARQYRSDQRFRPTHRHRTSVSRNR